MLNDIFTSMPSLFVAEVVPKEVTYYMSIDDVKKTIIIDSKSCRVEDGKTIENADCVCKTTEEFFLKIWNDGYMPGMGDFLSGKIKSNNPAALKNLMKIFGKI